MTTTATEMTSALSEILVDLAQLSPTTPDRKELLDSLVERVDAVPLDPNDSALCDLRHSLRWYVVASSLSEADLPTLDFAASWPTPRFRAALETVSSYYDLFFALFSRALAERNAWRPSSFPEMIEVADLLTPVVTLDPSLAVAGPAFAAYAARETDGRISGPGNPPSPDVATMLHEITLTLSRLPLRDPQQS